MGMIIFSSSKIAIWFYFISPISLLILSILTFTSGFTVIHSSIFIVAALEPSFHRHLLTAFSHVI